MTLLKRYGWLAVVPGLMLLIAVQLMSAKEVEKRIGELRALLADTQRVTIELTHAIGYGGLIHNFKNLVLRADRDGYAKAASEDAARAIRLADELERQAASLEVAFTLQSTRRMVRTYAGRVAEVERLHRRGEPVAAIDRAVSFDDQNAISEIDLLLRKLSRVVALRVERIETDADTMNRLAIGASLMLGSLVLALLLTRLQGRRHARDMREMNRKLERVNAGLNSANTALQQFAGMASHDLRTPLRHIDFFGDMIIEDADEPDEVREHAQVIKGVVRRTDTLIDSLLDFTRTGFARPERLPVDVATLIGEIVEELQPALQACGATIRTRLEGCVMADPELLRRAVHNVLGNSLKYVHPGRAPHIDIVATARADRVQIAISDNGIGIEPKFAERIFEPCQRLHDNQSAYTGTGIGLSLAKAVMNSHEGSLHLDTDHRDGARFVFCLEPAAPVLGRAANESCLPSARAA